MPHARIRGLSDPVFAVVRFCLACGMGGAGWETGGSGGGSHHAGRTGKKQSSADSRTACQETDE